MSAASSALSTREQLHFASLENKKAGLLIISDRAGDSLSAGKKRQKILADDIEVEVVEHHT